VLAGAAIAPLLFSEINNIPKKNMDIRSGFVATVGNTPLIRLRAASEATGCDIYGKAEFLNPGGSVKDRAALAIITDAERTAH
jgi:cysteine synthase